MLESTFVIPYSLHIPSVEEYKDYNLILHFHVVLGDLSDRHCWVAQCKEITGIILQADSLEELAEDIRNVVNDWFEMEPHKIEEVLKAQLGTTDVKINLAYMAEIHEKRKKSINTARKKAKTKIQFKSYELDGKVLKAGKHYIETFVDTKSPAIKYTNKIEILGFFKEGNRVMYITEDEQGIKEGLLTGSPHFKRTFEELK